MEHTIQVEKEDMIFNVLSIGEVKSGETASATITGKEPNQILNLTLPKGETGAIGPTGAKGDKGDTPVKGTDYWTTSDKQEIVSNVLNEIDIPTKTSDLANDSGFITNAVNDLINYYLKNETYSKNEVNTLVNNITKVTISVVDTLPTTGESNIIYFVAKTGSTNDVYDEYVWISNAWEHIGSTDVDLTGYATESWVNTQIANFLTEAQVSTLITNALTNYALKSEIPTKNSQLQNDSGFITGFTETDPTVPTHVKGITENDISNWNNKSSFSGNYEDLNNIPVTIKKITSDVNLHDLDSGIYIYTGENSIYLNVTSNRTLPMKKNDVLFLRKVEQSINFFSLNSDSWDSRFFYGYLTSRNNGNIYVKYIDKLLQYDNTSSFTPTSNYNLVHKKYVDDTIKSKINATFTLDGTTLNINTEA